MSRTVIRTDRGPRAIGPYSQAVVSDGWVYVSGQIPLDPATGRMIEGGITEQTERALANLTGILEAAGSSASRVLRATVYLVDMGDFEAMNAVYARYFSSDPPARVCVAVAALPRGARVEIDAVARPG